MSVRSGDRRATAIGAVVAVAATLLLTVASAAVAGAVNSPGSRSVAEPVLWAVGGGVGLALGAGTASWLTRRVLPGVVAALFGVLPFLALVIVAYNDDSLQFEDQLVGTAVVVVAPGFVAAVLVATAAAVTARLFGPRRPRTA